MLLVHGTQHLMVYETQTGQFAFHFQTPDINVQLLTYGGHIPDNIHKVQLWCFHTRARQRQDNDKTNVEPVHSYDAFHTISNKPGVKGIIGMHRFNICLVLVLSRFCSASGVKTPLVFFTKVII